jgi:DNA replication licensing factor MCM6
MPRSFEVILRNDLCDTAQPGDTCIFTGMLCVVPDISSMLKPGERTQVISRNI